MVRFSWLSFLGQLKKHLPVAHIFGIDLAQPPKGLKLQFISVLTREFYDQTVEPMFSS